MSLKESIIATKDKLAPVRCPVPEWETADEPLYIRQLTGLDRDRMQVAFESFRSEVNGDAEDITGYTAFTVAWCLVDKSGKRVFEDHEVLSLASASGKVLDKVYRFAAEVNGLGQYAENVLPKSSGADPSA
jgi:hypothetical protein